MITAVTTCASPWGRASHRPRSLLGCNRMTVSRRRASLEAHSKFCPRRHRCCSPFFPISMPERSSPAVNCRINCRRDLYRDVSADQTNPRISPTRSRFGTAGIAKRLLRSLLRSHKIRKGAVLYGFLTKFTCSRNDCSQLPPSTSCASRAGCVRMTNTVPRRNVIE